MATKNERIEFVRKIYPAAARLYRAGGVHPLFVTAQAALETGWKIKGIGNNIFGITKGSSWTGPVSLELTTEYFRTPDVKFKAPERVVSVEQVAPGKYKYRVYRYFRNFASVDECLDNHLELLRKPAMPMRGRTATIRKNSHGTWWTAPGKYATAPGLCRGNASMIDNVARIVKENRL